ncbi:MAG: glutamate--cysteine ligase [SAR116 cluster bacterium]|nr:MAG: glutamate--cysteine ligase [SAR116 cluster bacterium]
MIAWIAGGETPVSDQKIGTEHEKFLFHRHNLAPVAYEGESGIGALLERLLTELGPDAEPIMEKGNIIGITDADGGAVSLEPGGQLELSGAPLDDIHQTCNETGRHLRHMKAAASPLDIGMLGIGYHPTARREDISFMPKGRYRIMSRHMPKVGTLGLDMMLRTCTVQVNLDFSDEADMRRKFRTSLALQPVATALFANSPFKDGAPSGWLSTRAQAWTDTDAARSGVPACVFDDYFGYEQWIDYILDVPMYFLHRGDDYIDVAGRSFRDFMDGMLTGFEGQMPSMGDFQDHITTAFPEVRLKRFLEMRGADGGAWGNICALPAFWVGLLYDEQALEEAAALAAPLNANDVMEARLSVSRDGLRGQLGGREVHDLAAKLVDMASAGLRRRARIDDSGGDETGYLAPLRNAIASGETPAERLLRLHRDSWGGDLTQIFEAERYS